MIIKISIVTELSPITLYQVIRERYQNTVILESLDGPSKLATQSVICFEPYLIVEIDGHEVYFNEKQVAANFHEGITQIRALLKSYAIESNEDHFSGGLLGFTSYDIIRNLEDISIFQKNTQFADAIYGLYLDGIVFNHLTNEIFYFHHSKTKSKLKEIVSLLENHCQDSVASFTFNVGNIEYKMSKEDFVNSVEKIKSKIIEGETFQTVLSQQIQFYLRGNKLGLYQRLREINPSPFMYFIEIKGYCIIGSSPELLISKKKDILTTYPIAGTRKLGRNKKENESLETNLLSDEKEIAEHNMLVDLARNDLGKVSTLGSVSVTEYMKIQYFSHVMHIVSKVESKIDVQLDQFDVFFSVFPAGTVSGAPKIRSMQIIDELEKYRRGPYAGSVGYFGIDQNMVHAIAIRTAFGKGRNFKIQAGAGIVMDSIAENEYQETLDKLDALLMAIRKQVVIIK